MNKNEVKVFVFLLFLILLFFLSFYFNLGEKLANLKGYLESLGWKAPIVFIIIYILATVLAIPAIALTVMAGVIFNSLLGRSF